jgi:hypothetical protein
MPIRPFLAGRAFDPETIAEMSRALEATCDALRLTMVDDVATRAVAQRIVELAQRGVRGADELHSLALQEFKNSATAEKGVVTAGQVSLALADEGLSGHYVVSDGKVVVTASDGRTTTAVIETSMLSSETLAKMLLLQLHRHRTSTDNQPDVLTDCP